MTTESTMEREQSPPAATNGDVSSNDKESTMRRWSDEMQADSSQEMESCLQLSLERIVHITRFERLMGKFVYDVSMQYDACNQNLNEAFDGIPHTKSNLKAKLSGLRAHFKGVAKKYRNDIYSGLQNSIVTNDAAVKSVRGKYAVQRNKLVEHRKQFHSEKQTLRQCIESAEIEIVRWYKNYDMNIPDAQDGSDGNIIGSDNATPPPAPVEVSATETSSWEGVFRKIGERDDAATEQAIGRIHDVLSQHAKILAAKQRYDDSVQELRSAYNEALDGFQDIESSRIDYVTRSVLQAALNRGDIVLDARPDVSTAASTSASRLATPTSMSTPSASSYKQQDRDANLAVTLEKKGKDIMANLFQQKTSNPYEPGQGVFEAETLGLPREIGELRDKLKSKFADHENQLVSIKFLTSILDKTIASAERLARDLQQIIEGNSTAENGDGSQTTNKQQKWRDASAIVGPSMLKSSDCMMQAFIAEARAMSEWSRRMQHVRHYKLNTFLMAAAKQMELESESDDAAWKMLCDAARKQSKVESKFKQTMIDNKRIRERARSADLMSRRNDSEDFDADDNSISENGRRRNSATILPKPQNKLSKAFARLPSMQGRSMSSVSDHSNGDIGTNNGNGNGIGNGMDAAFHPKNVSKAFGNMLSAIPNSAGNAMKMLNAEGSLAVGMKKEADETKERQILDSADAIKSRTMTSYKSFTEERLKKVIEFERNGNVCASSAWDAMLSGLEVLDITKEKMEEASISIKDEHSNKSFESSSWLKEAQLRTNSTNATQGDDLLTLSLHGLDKTSGSTAIDKIKLLSDANEPIPESLAAAIQGLQEQYQGRIETNVSTPGRNPRSINSSPLSPPHINSQVTPNGGPKTSPQNGTSPKSNPAEIRAIRSFSESFFEGESDDDIPKLLASYSCSYKPKEKGISLTTPINGTLFLTAKSIHFFSSNDRKFVIGWDAVIALQKEKTFMGGENAILLTYKSEKPGSAFVIGRLQNRDSALRFMQQLMQKSSVNNSAKENIKSPAKKSKLPVVKRDAVVNDKMVKIFEKSLHGVTIERFYNNIFSEGQGTDAGPFYEGFLNKEECFDISVGRWEVAAADGDNNIDDATPFKSAWCGESYSQKRQVSFKFNRKTHLYIGPPVAQVNQAQYCRVEGKDRCVVAMALTFEGIPYSDCFSVHARWAARRLGDNDLKVEVGIQVEFRKKTLLANQIKTGTITETTPVHERLFEEARRALGAEAPPKDGSSSSSADESGVEEDGAEQGGDDIGDRAARSSRSAVANGGGGGGILSSINSVMDMLPVDRSFLFGAGTMLGLVVLRGWLFGAGSSRNSSSSSEIRELKAQMDEMQKALQDVLVAVNKR